MKEPDRGSAPTPGSLSVRAGDVVVAYPLFQAGGGGSTPTPALSAKSLVFSRCSKELAVSCVRRWHSRLPRTQAGPWQFAFCAELNGEVVAVALWNNPSGRCLPGHWLELRRMAASARAPKNTCSRFLAWMVRYFRAACPERDRCISYQDTAVHEGTIYKAAGWTMTALSRPRVRDRSKSRTGTTRAYRSNMNGVEADASAKARWEICLQ